MDQTLSSTRSKKACVIGGTGNLGSILIKHLLLNGYKVNTTVRDPENEKKIAHLRQLQELGDLKIFKADLTVEESFDSSFSGCEYIFHVATPINFTTEDPEKDVIKPAIQGVINVLKSCLKSKSIKRVIYTSSAAAVCINNLSGPGLVINEENWTDIDFLKNKKPFGWGYLISKTLAEKKAYEFAKENKIDLVTVIPSVITGNSLLSDPPSSVYLSMSLITGKEKDLIGLKEMQKLSGSISFIQVDDLARAHLFLAEKETASGRYICCAYNTSVPMLSDFLRQRYPKYNVLSDTFEDCSLTQKLRLSSEKLMNEGFQFEYGINEMYDQMIESFEAKALIKARDS